MNATTFAQKGYAATAAPVRTHRGAEYLVFQKVTSSLSKAMHSSSTKAQQAEALHDNRRLWSALAVDLASDENQLPQTLRAQLFYLAEFSLLQSAKALQEPQALGILIEINKSVMRGLHESQENP
ncbi:MAG: flagellar biosynthesis regulator FlaF [Pseudomonadota bacterium]